MSRTNDGELGRSLRQWRDRISPAEVGLAGNGPRRAAGLRREELALLAGLSADYVTRLEQGRSVSPSAQVLNALARALRLSGDEREYLFRLAGQPLPSSGRISAQLTPGVDRLLRRLDDVPIGVYDAAWNLVAWNPVWAALMGDPSRRRGRSRNLPWQYFTGGQGRVVRDPAETAAFEVSMVADLRAAAARYPCDEDLARLIGDLRRASERFAGLWQDRSVSVRAADRKQIDHPEVGPLTLDCDVLTVQGADLRVITYTAEPGSGDADKLALLLVLGLQAMSG
ncbi:MAG: helix-turn-helix transcriptional regulator [Actinomycetota bacterium]